MKPRVILLPTEESEPLRGIVRRGTSSARDVLRARVVLSCAAGMRKPEGAAHWDTRVGTVGKWRTRFLADAWRGSRLRLAAASRHATPKRPNGVFGPSWISLFPPDSREGTGRCSRALADSSDAHVWRVLRKHGIALARRRRWGVATDPAFAQQAADVVGL